MEAPINTLNASDVLKFVNIIQAIDFSSYLQSLLEEKHGTKSALYEFLRDRDFHIEKTSLYRYFNPSTRRIPPARFLELFTEYLHLSDMDREALIDLWWMKRQHPRCPQINQYRK